MTDTTTEEEPEAEVVETDERREALLAAMQAELGDAVTGSYIRPGNDIWVRVGADAWLATATYLRHGLNCRYFNFLSAIDWQPSPFGRDMDAMVDHSLDGTSAKEPEPVEMGYAGGDTRFQVFARVNNIEDMWGITLKADVGDDMEIDSWISEYSGANWHERETWEMYGISFRGHPDMRNLYLPTDFQGNPLRKDFPLLARQVKPWPGIVDVELLPGEGDDDDAEAGEESPS
ncbi:MAG: NADH-quinone oxidoreductase subunit C [Acidimicrobiales bacterium]